MMELSRVFGNLVKEGEENQIIFLLLFDNIERSICYHCQNVYEDVNNKTYMYEKTFRKH